MAIPKYDEMYRELLEALSDGQARKIRELRDLLAEKLGVTQEERAVLLPSGRQQVFNSRVNWTATYLKNAGLVHTTSRGIYEITLEGQKLLHDYAGVIDNQLLMKFDSFQQFVSPGHANDSQDVDTPAPVNQMPAAGQTPQDILDDAYQKINHTLMDDLLDEVMKKDPIFFEHLVVELLLKMGYGGSLENAGTVTKASGDEGIDGIIREDKLGFDKIYIQAKRWDRDSAVGRPELQKFVGALAGQGASKGLFITTAKFTAEARQYVSYQHTTKIVLVDGAALAKLMVEYDVGVSPESTYTIKKIDSDFFDTDLT